VLKFDPHRCFAWLNLTSSNPTLLIGYIRNNSRITFSRELTMISCDGVRKPLRSRLLNRNGLRRQFLNRLALLNILRSSSFLTIFFLSGKSSLMLIVFSFPTITEYPSNFVPLSTPNTASSVSARIPTSIRIPNVPNFDQRFSATPDSNNFLALAGVVGVKGLLSRPSTKTECADNRPRRPRVFSP